jgi:hypothetical protein
MRAGKLAKKTTKAVKKPIRSRRIKMSASIKSATKIIAEQMGLPEGSVSLILPTGRRKNGTTNVQSLWDSWKAKGDKK